MMTNTPLKKKRKKWINERQKFIILGILLLMIFMIMKQLSSSYLVESLQIAVIPEQYIGFQKILIIRINASSHSRISSNPVTWFWKEENYETKFPLWNFTSTIKDKQYFHYITSDMLLKMIIISCQQTRTKENYSWQSDAFSSTPF